MVWLSPNAGETYWLWSNAGYWHHGDPSFEVHSWSRGLSWQWADNEDPHLESSQLLLPLQLRRIRQVCWLVRQDVAQHLVSAFILSWLDYCNTLLSRLPRSTIQPLQHVMNAAAQVIMNLSLHDHVSQLWSSYIGCQLSKALYTSCVCSCITSTLDKHHNTCQTISTVSALSGRYRLRSTGSVDYVLPRTKTKFGERGSPAVAQPPGTLFLPTSMTLLTPVHSENDPRVYLLIVLTTDYC